jgi:hypothetical protein
MTGLIIYFATSIAVGALLWLTIERSFLFLRIESVPGALTRPGEIAT